MRVKSVAATAVATLMAFGVSAGVLFALDHGPAARQPQPAAGENAELASERLSADDDIAFWARRVDANPRDYLSRTQLASQYLRRGREVHNPADAVPPHAQVEHIAR